MFSATARVCLLAIICFGILGSGFPEVEAQKRRSEARQTPKPKPTPEPTEQTTESNPEFQQVETLKIDTNLVTIPVIAVDPNGVYAPDLTKADFDLFEDGAKQEIAFFATVTTPFHVVLMLDTSASTREKLNQMQRAASAFVDQLQPQDKVKVISFENVVRDLNEFTSDRGLLKAAINKTVSGDGTKFYDAMELALRAVRPIQGRKAIVLFSDGVDWHSDMATFDGTLHALDEESVIVYPIRYETRAETERLARQQAEEISPQLPTIGVIRAPSSGGTATTFPSDEPSQVPTTTTRRTGPLGLPLPDEILRRRRDGQPYPPPDVSPFPDPKPSSTPRTDPTPTTTTRAPEPKETDSISAMLDREYLTADSYLLELAKRSGGRLLRADSISSLPDAFSKIAAELRTQYAISYYPSNKQRDGKYRKIKVSTMRKNVSIRARPGYLATTIY
jgi:Ca-activated chloride channel homolog